MKLPWELITYFNDFKETTWIGRNTNGQPFSFGNTTCHLNLHKTDFSQYPKYCSLELQVRVDGILAF